LGIFGSEQGDQRLATQAAPICLQHAQGGPVGLLDDALVVGDQVSVRCEFEESSVAPALMLGRFPGGPQFGLLPAEFLGDGMEFL
jgi:hypothetical protein